ncbi:protein of unknown function (putative phage tail fiber protein) [Magnetospirillum sp. XM-1]|uniref:phage tail assembly chaperone n=1 Tax=Magnetospirillum sp. XM-1 TaxID=1663591 RepID=UPI00073DFF91|nr:phage tail assembly chaperone [Magnetospirillum sp. XM-1]CUW41153.1 protein of unknown function (putative phage tail fiber protein) [Magnetospirillum sp. XM-1]
MTIWTDQTLIPIAAAAPYTDADGVQHLGQRDKATIPGLMMVTPADRPPADPTGYTVDGQARGGVAITMIDGREWRIEMIGGVPTQVWNTVERAEMTADEAQAVAVAALRIERDRRLSASDIMVLPDRWEGYTPEQRAAWTAYRQALRDLPEAAANPAAPVWPAVPVLA